MDEVTFDDLLYWVFTHQQLNVKYVQQRVKRNGVSNVQAKREHIIEYVLVIFLYTNSWFAHPPSVELHNK